MGIGLLPCLFVCFDPSEFFVDPLVGLFVFSDGDGASPTVNMVGQCGSYPEEGSGVAVDCPGEVVGLFLVHVGEYRGGLID